MQRGTKIIGIALVILIAIVGVIWYAVIREDRGGKLTVSFLNVGQGDAIFIDAPSGRQVLIDGGPSGVVLRELSRAMPFYDRTIDVVIPTHPDADHIGGLIDVLARFRVNTIIGSSVKADTKTSQAAAAAASAEGARMVTARRGQIVDLGHSTNSGLRAYLEILSPDRDVSGADTNGGCVVTRLVYGNTAFMLPCDAPQEIENYLVRLDSADLHSDVLKTGHHGSRTSSSELFVGFVNPSYGVFSRGCDNKYGHPHKEVIDTFAKFQIPTFDTCEGGTITFVSDGQSVMVK